MDGGGRLLQAPWPGVLVVLKVPSPPVRHPNLFFFKYREEVSPSAILIQYTL